MFVKLTLLKIRMVFVFVKHLIHFLEQVNVSLFNHIAHKTRLWLPPLVNLFVAVILVSQEISSQINVFKNANLMSNSTITLASAIADKALFEIQPIQYAMHVLPGWTKSTTKLPTPANACLASNWTEQDNVLPALLNPTTILGLTNANVFSISILFTWEDHVPNVQPRSTVHIVKLSTE